MAVNASEERTRLLIKVENGLTASGHTAYAERSFADMSPSLSNDDFFAVGKGLAGLQANTLNAIRRQTTVTLAEE